jgi:hypothetical protein
MKKKTIKKLEKLHVPPTHLYTKLNGKMKLITKKITDIDWLYNLDIIDCA